MNSISLTYLSPLLSTFLIICYFSIIIPINSLEQIYNAFNAQSFSQYLISRIIDRPTKLNELNQLVNCTDMDLSQYRLIIELKLTYYKKRITQPLIFYSQSIAPNISEFRINNKQYTANQLIFDQDAYYQFKDYHFLAIPFDKINFNQNITIGIYDTLESGQTFNYQLLIYHDINLSICPKSCSSSLSYGTCISGTCKCNLECFDLDCSTKSLELKMKDNIKSRILSKSWRFYFTQITPQMKSIIFQFDESIYSQGFSWIFHGQYANIHLPNEEYQYQIIQPHNSQLEIKIDELTLQNYYEMDNSLIQDKGRILVYGIYNLNDNLIDISLTIYSSNISDNQSDTTNMGTIIIILIVVGCVLFIFGIYIYFRIQKQDLQVQNLNNQPQSVPNNVNNQVSLQQQQQRMKLSERLINKFMPLFTFEAINKKYPNLQIKECTVCLTEFENVDNVRLTEICYHLFHADCLEQWLKRNESCPFCRHPFDRYAIKDYLINKKKQGETSYIKHIISSNNLDEMFTPTPLPQRGRVLHLFKQNQQQSLGSDREQRADYVNSQQNGDPSMTGSGQMLNQHSTPPQPLRIIRNSSSNSDHDQQSMSGNPPSLLIKISPSNFFQDQPPQQNGSVSLEEQHLDIVRKISSQQHIQINMQRIEEEKIEEPQVSIRHNQSYKQSQFASNSNMPQKTGSDQQQQQMQLPDSHAHFNPDESMQNKREMSNNDQIQCKSLRFVEVQQQQKDSGDQEDFKSNLGNEHINPENMSYNYSRDEQHKNQINDLKDELKQQELDSGDQLKQRAESQSQALHM